MTRALAAGGLLALAGCYAFAEPTLDTCGNNIVEAEEDCDGGAPLSCTRDCRLVCEPDSADPGCPVGYACDGQDEICRKPSGEFAVDPIRISRPGAQWFEIGDLDDDQHQDVVVQVAGPGVEAIHVDEFGFEIVPIAEAAARAGLGDVDGDGRDDVLLGRTPAAGAGPGTGGGVALVREGLEGADDRVPQPVYFATVRTDGANARLLSPTQQRDRVLEIVSPTQTRHWSRALGDAVDLSPALGVGQGKLGYAIAVANLDADAMLSCGGFTRPEVALATGGEATVRIGSTCGGAEPFELWFFPEVNVPGGMVIGDAGTFFVDANDDMRPDLVTQADSGAVLVAWGVGDGSFDASDPPPDMDGDGAFASEPLWDLGEDPGRLLAAANFDGDPAVELVTTDYFVDDSAVAWPEQLDSAVIVDLNDDEALDIAGLHGDVLDVYLLDSVLPLDFEPQSVSLLGGADEAVVGDFDHDTIDDVAFLELDSAATTDANHNVAILHGGDVEDWRIERFGPFVGAQTLAAESEGTLVVRTVDSQARHSGAFIEPGQIVHDFGFVVRQPVVVRTATGPLAASVALRPGDAEETVAHLGFADGTLSPHDVTVTAGLLPGLPAGEGGTALAVAIDLVEPELATDELVVLGNAVAGGTAWVLHLDTSTAAWTLATSFPIGPRLSGSTIAVGDVDGDGDPDVLATTDESLRRVVVLLNDDGVLSAARMHLLSSTSGFGVAHVEPWHVDQDGVAQWLVADNDSMALARLDLEGDRILVEDLALPGRPQALASADVDGDGLLDLVLGTATDIRIHLAEETIGAD